MAGLGWAGPGLHQSLPGQHWGEGTRAGAGQAARTPQHCRSHSLTLLGHFNFIYKHDENPSSINLRERKRLEKKKKKKKENHRGAGQELVSIPERRGRVKGQCPRGPHVLGGCPG